MTDDLPRGGDCYRAAYGFLDAALGAVADRREPSLGIGTGGCLESDAGGGPCGMLTALTGTPTQRRSDDA